MRATALVLALVLAGHAMADDAPVLGSTPLGVASVTAGEPSPGDGCWLSDEACIKQATRIQKCEAELKACAQPVVFQPPNLLPASAAFILGVLVGGAVAWYAASR